MKALYPGSFDPLTNGHLDLITRAAELFDEVIVAVLINQEKKATFEVERRCYHITEATKHLEKVKVITFKGLTVNCARKNDVDLIIRGLRAMSDFEYELQIAHTNRSLDEKIETVFLATETHHSFLSSSVVKEVARFGGETCHMVPHVVANDLKLFFN